MWWVHAIGLEEALKRKDAIIRVRNAQISALWDELHTRQPWTNALSGDAPINLATETPVNASRKLLVIGINTVGLYSPALWLCGRPLVHPLEAERRLCMLQQVRLQEQHGGVLLSAGI